MDLTSAPSAALERLRRASLGSLLALLIQYGLGIGVAIYVTIPDADQGHGPGTAMGKALTGGPAVLSAHVVVGTLLIVNVLVVAVLAVRTRVPVLMATAVVGLLCVLGAWFSGASFVDKDQNSASMGMAVLTGVALACYAVNLYILGSRRPA
jgi:hypothetical protein